MKVPQYSRMPSRAALLCVVWSSWYACFHMLPPTTHARTYSLTRTRRFVCFVVARSTMESASLELRASRRRSATRSSSTFRLVLWYAALAHTLRSRDLIRVHDSSADVNVLRVVHGALGARGSTVGYCSSLVVSLSLSLSNDSSCCTK